MDLNKFTIKMQEAIERANQFAGEESHSELTSAHILIALLDQKEGVIRPLLEKLGVSVQSVDSSMRNVLSKLPKAVNLKYPSPLGPKPEPGVPTIFFSSNNLSKNSHEVIPFGTLSQIYGALIPPYTV